MQQVPTYCYVSIYLLLNSMYAYIVLHIYDNPTIEIAYWSAYQFGKMHINIIIMFFEDFSESTLTLHRYLHVRGVTCSTRSRDHLKYMIGENCGGIYPYCKWQNIIARWANIKNQIQDVIET